MLLVLSACLDQRGELCDRTTFVDNFRGIYVEKTDDSQFHLPSGDLTPECYEVSSFTELSPSSFRFP